MYKHSPESLKSIALGNGKFPGDIYLQDDRYIQKLEVNKGFFFFELTCTNLLTLQVLTLLIIDIIELLRPSSDAVLHMSRIVCK